MAREANTPTMQHSRVDLHRHPVNGERGHFSVANPVFEGIFQSAIDKKLGEKKRGESGVANRRMALAMLRSVLLSTNFIESLARLVMLMSGLLLLNRCIVSFCARFFPKKRENERNLRLFNVPTRQIYTLS